MLLEALMMLLVLMVMKVVSQTLDKRLTSNTRMLV